LGCGELTSMVVLSENVKIVVDGGIFFKGF
jgi:hypothetical protein